MIITRLLYKAFAKTTISILTQGLLKLSLLPVCGIKKFECHKGHPNKIEL